ncbi:MAG: N-acetyl-alpha-D-glucosaminyl L-malate synthase BshA [Actinomycetota bacterium]|nr:N-acetyl-alpha-D-glucosaminyl L-malate synthase BshA [Actinomycetota bacterium]
MKIGITCYPTYGGSGAVATELGIELAKRGHTIHFVSYGLPFRLNHYYENIFFHEVEILEYPLFKYLPYSLSLSAKMAEVIDSEQLDILHVHYAIPHAASAYLAKKISSRSIKYITTLHGTDITIVGNHASFFGITKFSIEQSDGISCVSSYLKEATDRIFKVNKPMKVIYNFVDTSRYRRKKVPASEFTDKGEKILVHISNFRPVKNVENVVKVFFQVHKKVPSKLLMVGDGPEIGNCRQLVNQLDLKDSVCFMGRQDDVVPLLSQADLFLQPSQSESFGLASLEALSCQVPVIGTSIGGLKEVIEGYGCGYVFDPYDVQGMAEAAIRILSVSGLREKMGRAARKRALDFDSNKIVPEYIDFYHQVLK